MKNLKLPLTQSAGYIYDANGSLLGRIMSAPLVEWQVRDLTDLTITALNTLLTNVEAVRDLKDSISKIDRLVMDMDLPTRNALNFHIEKAHKATKKLFTNSKLLTAMVKCITE